MIFDSFGRGGAFVVGVVGGGVVGKTEHRIGCDIWEGTLRN